MIFSKKLLSELESKATSRTTVVRLLEDDLRKRCDEFPEVDAPLRAQYDEAKEKKRTAFTYQAWRDGELAQIAVAWVLGCVFVRFLEDNELVEVPKLSGPGDRLQRARDEHELFFRQRPTETEREYLHMVFEEVGKLPAMREFFDRKHNPLWLVAPSGDACRELWQFWQKTDPETGDLIHDFTDSEWNTRFLGDLYQDLSEAARKRYALLQTPDFVEEFILDRTLTPAIDTFGYKVVRLIDPTCGSGHFLLGTFARLFRIWQEEAPGENPRVLAQRALDGVYGVDLNPFAVAIARFRLLLAALRVCGDVQRLKDAPDFSIHLAVGDSLLHGARFRPFEVETRRQAMFETDEELFKDELAHFFDTEDSAELHRILGQQYHAVVGNPPYIAVEDKALNQLYRARYDACHKQYSLSVPFMERFFDLALTGSGDGREVAGFTGQITANSFTKADFGKKLIEEHIPRWDLTHVIDTSGASIPGHGTPTVILFGRNAKPVAMTLRMVMGIKGEPRTPDDPAKGKVWRAIVDQVDHPGSESEFVSVVNTERSELYRHPWSLAGGGTSKIKFLLESTAPSILGDHIEDIGRTTHTGDDNALCIPPSTARTKGFAHNIVLMVRGQDIRDYVVASEIAAIFPYDQNGLPIPREDLPEKLWHYFWTLRSPLKARSDFGNRIEDRGLRWFDHSMFFPARFRAERHIAFSNVSTHNHFGAHSGARLFNSHAPAMQTPKNAGDTAHFSLLAVSNSSVGCFWMKQVFQGKHKGDGGEAHATPEYQRFEFSSTKLKQFPVPAASPLILARELDRLAQELSVHSPDALAARDAVSAAALTEAEQTAADRRALMISFQEELDWQCYRLYGLIVVGDNLEWPEDRLDALPPLTLGERAFEIRMAQQVVAGELETSWFERHSHVGSRPITELPASWPDDYRALVERRLAFIEANKNINLIERPEYKRRWNTEPWAKRQKEALRKWLLARLEGYFFEGSRVCDLGTSFDPAAHGFTTSTRPHLVTANQLADVVSSDSKFLEAAEVYEGASGFSVAKLVRTLVESESVPFLPAHRYKESGLRKREDWESTWELQRKEDAIEASVRAENTQATEEQLKDLIRKAQQDQVGDIPVPPKYIAKDFAKSSFWKLRGKLDVPKERWISYPGAERDGDDSLLIAWAGWDHLQQAKALAEYFIDTRDNHGWLPDKLKSLLAGLADLLPWLKQWHNTHDPDLGMGMGDYFAGFLEEECRKLDVTLKELDQSRFAKTN